MNAQSPLFAASDVPDVGAEPDRDTWTSPLEIVGPLGRFAHVCGNGPAVDLDPCSNERSIVQCRRRFTREDAPTADPIRPWGGTAYVNWPWSSPEPWVRACYEESQAGHCPWIVGCGIADPSVGWFAHVWRADLVCWPDHRVMFDAPPGAKASSNSHPIMLPLWIDPLLGNRSADPIRWVAVPLAAIRKIRRAFIESFGHLGPITPRPETP